MTDQTRTLPLSRLPRDRDCEFLLQPDAAEREALAQELGVTALRKLRFAGALRAEGARDWRLTGQLGVTIIQPCVVSLEPVSTRIDTPVLRSYVADLPEPDPEEEYEIPEDDSLEPLPASLDLVALLAEALALNIPLYPRADGASLGTSVYAAPGVTPMTDEDAKPLAGLAALKARLQEDDPSDG